MKLNSFKANNVHGHLEFDIEFFPELTFLLGINGSGKTSALKLILGLITPSYTYLSQIRYSFAELVCSSKTNEKDIIIRALQDEKSETFRFYVITSNGQYETPRIKRQVFSEDDNFDMEEISMRERASREEFDSYEATQVIQKLATPKFLGLDRKIYEGRDIDLRLRNRRMHMNFKRRRQYEGYTTASAIDSSLEEVQMLVYEYFRVIASQQPRISEDYKKRIFQLSFNFLDDDTLDNIPNEPTEILEKKGKVLRAVKSLDIDYLTQSAEKFFDKMEEIVEQNKNAPFLKKNDLSEAKVKLLRKWFNNSSQMRRIDEIIKFSQTYQEKIAELRAPVKRLEDITANFFREGKKEILVAADGELKVKLNKRTGSVYELSSGEKQIIIMIAHLIFEEDQKPSGVFIIDEPELSLHIAWQDIFVDSIKNASPKTQFILATHSPSIISNVEREKYCQDLNKLNY